MYTLEACGVDFNVLLSLMIYVKSFACDIVYAAQLSFNNLSVSTFYIQQHVGWWSPTIIRGEDREAVHIPNHKFTVNVVRNLTQKSHWRIKTHLAISHLDVSKINVSDLDHICVIMTLGAPIGAHLLHVTTIHPLSIYRILLLTCAKSWPRILKLNSRSFIEEFFWKTSIPKIKLLWLVHCVSVCDLLLLL